jgi:seryl-tRNA synthetase
MSEFDKHTSVYGDLQEVVELEDEIKRLNKHLKELRIQKKEAEARIYEFLKDKDQIGFKHKDITVTIAEKKCRYRKNNDAKKDEILQVIQNSRDPTSKEALEDIVDALKGDLYIKNCIKIQKSKKI